MNDTQKSGFFTGGELGHTNMIYFLFNQDRTRPVLSGGPIWRLVGRCPWLIDYNASHIIHVFTLSAVLPQCCSALLLNVWPCPHSWLLCSVSCGTLWGNRVSGVEVSISQRWWASGEGGIALTASDTCRHPPWLHPPSPLLTVSTLFKPPSYYPSLVLKQNPW